MIEFINGFERYTERGIVQKCYLLVLLSGGAAAEMAKTRPPRKGSDAGAGGVKRGQKSRFFEQSVVLRVKGDDS